MGSIEVKSSPSYVKHTSLALLIQVGQQNKLFCYTTEIKTDRLLLKPGLKFAVQFYSELFVVILIWSQIILVQ